MTRILSRAAALLLLSVTACVWAAEPAAAPTTTGGLLRMLLGLVLVLVLMGGAVWMLRRFGVASAAAPGVVKLVGGIGIGGRERILVVEVGDQWIVVGVAPGRVNALATLPKREAAAMPHQSLPNSKSFASWLQQTIEKRNAR